MMAVRKGDWKLVRASDGPSRVADSAALKDLSTAELYNLATDISETNNVAAANPEKVEELAEEWQRWNRELVRPRWVPLGRRPPRDSVRTFR